MGPIARVLWDCLPELVHVGGVLAVAALMLATMGTALFGDRAASFSTFSGILLATPLACFAVLLFRTWCCCLSILLAARQSSILKTASLHKQRRLCALTVCIRFLMQ